ncbi:ectoine hydroxylase-related dioxygenase (phytanoyl-CoA dioxygenase family) [Friedmanniella endophytica]|uniref:Ectoine hydroxylase-related dioxygenase (Phytanoyl-CoA dioxygenase family) n=1 Tax=Microlunatus kandeliicorticis TaxID=1759536 RepID=A0A7W3P450_9ACTN|nr:phytanoyl-CoA dioxygenase family protein [Microlunatus kandeliicorticis]MBA8792539.1 ectoine hydroxylase-related dioxygenase (phytanoyl-CoA dioxygenase family) [Microlunatus kandeliicorticis]
MTITDARPVLSTSDLEQFDELGYVVVKGALSRAEAEHYRQQILSLVPPTLELPATWGSHDGRIKPMYSAGNHTFDTPDLIPLMANPTLYAAASQLLGSPKLRVLDGSIGITLRNDAHRDTALSQTLHIDASVPNTADDFTFEPAELQVGGCYYLTDVEPGGGGIHVVPGGHRRVAEEAKAHGPGGRHLRENWKRIEDMESIEITGEAGDFALLHHLMPHGASHNRNPTTRVAYFVRWVREDQTWGAGAKPAPGAYNTHQTEAMGELGRKLFGVDDW